MDVSQYLKIATFVPFCDAAPHIQISGPAIYTKNPHRHNTTAPHCNPNTCHTPPVPTGLVNPKPNPLTPRPEPHIHISHIPPTPPTSSSALAFLSTRHYTWTTCTTHTLTPALLSPAQHTYMQHKQYTHHSHHTHIGYEDNLTDRSRTTTWLQRPSSKSERNLIILQVNINGIKNKRLIQDTCRWVPTEGVCLETYGRNLFNDSHLYEHWT